MKKPKSYATFPQQVAICERLNGLLTVIERDEAPGKALVCRYKPGHTDISVAEAMGEGLTPPNIANVRLQMFGKLHVVAKADGAYAEVGELRAALIKLSGEFTAAGIRHAREMGHMQGRTAEIVEIHNKLVEYLTVNRTVQSSRDFKIQKIRATEELPAQAAE